MRPKNAFSVALSIHLASLFHENQLKIGLKYLFVHNKMRSKISFMIKQFQVLSSVLAFFLDLAELTEVETKYFVAAF